MIVSCRHIVKPIGKSCISDFSSHGITQFYLDSCTCQNMYPQSLCIAKSIILRFDFREHDLFLLRIPKEKIRYTAPSLLVFLRHHLAHCCQGRTAEALHDFYEVVKSVRPVYADDTGLFWELAFVDLAYYGLSLAVGKLNQSVIDLRRTRRVECICVEIQRTGLEWRLKDVRDVGEKYIIE